MWNRHNVIECSSTYRNPKTRNFTKLVQVRNFLFTFLSLKVFRNEERETQSFYADWFYIFSFQPNQRAAPVAHKVVWPRPVLKVNLLLPRQELKSAFSQISAHASGAWRHPNNLVNSYLGFLFWPLWMTYPLRARAWTQALTNPCAKRKVLKLNRKARYIKRNPSAIVLQYIFIYTYWVYHHHHIVPQARISRTLSLSPLLPIVHRLW